MSKFVEHHFRSRDGLTLYYREYAGAANKVPVLCLAGLTRHSGDFARLAEFLAPTRRVICPDQRGRGRSQHDPNWLNYHPGAYVEDMWTLLRELGLERVIVIGTSLGGVMAMLMASVHPRQLAGVVLNDVGPELRIAGSQRIQSHLGRMPQLADWNEAAAHLKATRGDLYPDFTAQAWEEFARNTYLEGADGRLRLSYDAKLAELMRLLPYGAMPPMWYAYAALQSIPTLAIRGALSDLLSEATFERMKREKPDLVQFTVANQGHAPLLHEPSCQDAIARFLAHLP